MVRQNRLPLPSPAKRLAAAETTNLERSWSCPRTRSKVSPEPAPRLPNRWPGCCFADRTFAVGTARRTELVGKSRDIPPPTNSVRLMGRARFAHGLVRTFMVGTGRPPTSSGTFRRSVASRRRGLGAAELGRGPGTKRRHWWGWRCRRTPLDPSLAGRALYGRLLADDLHDLLLGSSAGRLCGEGGGCLSRGRQGGHRKPGHDGHRHRCAAHGDSFSRP